MKKYILLLFIATAPFCFSQKADHKKTAIQVLGWLNKKEFMKVTALFDSTMSSQIDAAKLEQVWTGLLGQTGGFKKAGSPAFSFNPGIAMIDQLIEFEKAAFLLRIGFDGK